LLVKLNISVVNLKLSDRKLLITFGKKVRKNEPEKITSYFTKSALHKPIIYKLFFNKINKVRE